jgi:hypothetical protein
LTVILVALLVEVNLLPENPYTRLRARLMTANHLSNIQRVEILFNLPLLGRAEAFRAFGGDVEAVARKTRTCSTTLLLNT